MSLQYSLYLILMFVACSFGAIRFSRFNKADKILYVLLFTTFCGESVAKICQLTLDKEMSGYLFLAPVQLLLISLYYNETVDILKRRRLGLWIGLAGIVIFLFSAYRSGAAGFPEPTSVFLAGFIIILLSLLSFYTLFVKEDFDVLRAMQFWSTATLTVFWTFSWCYFCLLTLFKEFLDFTNAFYVAFAIMHLLTYSGFTILFIYYPKLKRSGE